MVQRDIFTMREDPRVGPKDPLGRSFCSPCPSISRSGALGPKGPLTRSVTFLLTIFQHGLKGPFLLTISQYDKVWAQKAPWPEGQPSFSQSLCIPQSWPKGPPSPKVSLAKGPLFCQPSVRHKLAPFLALPISKIEVYFAL